MIKIWTKIKIFESWIKRKIKHILIMLGIIGAAYGATLLTPTTTIPSISVNGQTITFPYIDENSNENLVIRTDRQNYVGGDNIYIAIQNKSGADQLVNLFFLLKNNQYLTDIERLRKNVPHLVKVPEYTTITYDCSYVASTTRKTIQKTCEKKKIIGYHWETRYKDEWQNIDLYKFSTKDYKSFVAMKAVKKKRDFVVRKRAEKKKKDFVVRKRAEVSLPKGKWIYLKAKIKAPLWGFKKQEFFIEAIGDNAYGLLDPFLTGYSYRKEITIDHTKIDADLTDFPVLVKLTSSNFDFSKAQSSGADIRFTSSDGTTLLSYERERHDATNQVAEYWVKIPSVSSTTDTEFYIYYGNPSATDGEDATNVWDSNYLAVWHLSESGNGTVDEYKDSTANANDGQGGGGTVTAVPTQIEGKIAKAQDFAQNEDYISFGNVLDANDNSGDTYVEAWVKEAENPTVSSRILDKMDPANAYAGYFLEIVAQTTAWAPSTDYAVDDMRIPTTANSYVYGVTVAGTSGATEPVWPTTIGATVTDGTVTWECKGKNGQIKFWIGGNGSADISKATSYKGIADGSWHHIVGYYKSGDQVRLFIDGEEATYHHFGNTYANSPANTVPLYMNWSTQHTSDNSAAIQIDEVRRCNLARSAAWIKASYHSGNDTLVSYGAEETSRKIIIIE